MLGSWLPLLRRCTSWRCTLSTACWFLCSRHWWYSALCWPRHKVHHTLSQKHLLSHHLQDHWVHVGCYRWHSCSPGRLSTYIQKTRWHSKGRSTHWSARCGRLPCLLGSRWISTSIWTQRNHCCRRNRCKTQTRVLLLSTSPRISRVL